MFNRSSVYLPPVEVNGVTYHIIAGARGTTSEQEKRVVELCNDLVADDGIVKQIYIGVKDSVEDRKLYIAFRIDSEVFILNKLDLSYTRVSRMAEINKILGHVNSIQQQNQCVFIMDKMIPADIGTDIHKNVDVFVNVATSSNAAIRAFNKDEYIRLMDYGKI